MTDQQRADSRTPAVKSDRGFRWIPAVVILMLGGGAIVAADQFTEDKTFLVIAVYYTVILTLLALLLWWLFFSRLTWITRIGGLIGMLVLGIGTMIFTIAEITFDGAMRPRVRWTWQPSPRDISSEWLTEHAREGTTASPVDAEFAVKEDDWPQFCGRNGDRIINEPMMNLNWDSNPPKELWRHPVGAAWSSFSVVGDRLYTQEQRDQQECVVCYHATTGEELWRREDETRYETPMGGTGPRATPTVTDTALFALGATGILNCLDPVTGEQRWQRNICEDAGSSVLEWGMSGSPLINGATVVVDAGGGSGKAVIAYDRATGDIVWAVQNHKAGYATPRIEQIAGTDQLLILNGDGLLSLDPLTGETFWEYPWTNLYKVNVAQPMRFGDHIFLSGGYDSGCVMIDPTHLTAGRPADVWPRNNHLKLKFNEAVSYDGYVYGLDDGILCCVDSRTGERAWKGGRYRFGQVLRCDSIPGSQRPHLEHARRQPRSTIRSQRV
jgi:outer membrane protein assembly factor BamB